MALKSLPSPAVVILLSWMIFPGIGVVTSASSSSRCGIKTCSLSNKKWDKRLLGQSVEEVIDDEKSAIHTRLEVAMMEAA